ncbi:MAG: FKBP-type peptidyl-prolyl cis-trans isomerase [Pedobacter sp.]|jgi:FKBP-type peptidyl-prolyl cis-trans isomerase FkpA
MKIHFLLFSLVMVFGLSSCLKGDNFDPALQAQQDDAIIVKFLADKNITAIKHSSGLYYQIIQPGSGSIVYTANTQVTTNYTGRLLSGVVFDKTTTQPVSFKLGQVIVGWQLGVPLIQKGGKIRLFIPSGYGYGPQSSGQIPANAVLDFDIELIDVQN